MRPRPQFRRDAARFVMDDRAGYTPMDRNRRVKLLHIVEVYERTTKRKGGRNGVVSQPGVAVLKALLLGFHRSSDGRCNPSYAAIMKRAGLCKASVAKGIRILERLGIVSVLRSIRRRISDLGIAEVRQASNRYGFNELPRLLPVTLPPVERRRPRVYGMNSIHKAVERSRPYWLHEGAQRYGEALGSAADWRERARAALKR